MQQGSLPSPDAASAADRLVSELGTYGSCLVAFSGGADSALVLAAAVRALGAGRAAAFTAVSPAVPAAERAAAASFAAALGVRHFVVDTGELDVAGYRANGPRRCYFCKSVVLDAALRVAAEHGLRTVATGTNADDVRDRFRPGIGAGAERGVRTPLAAAGLSKAEVRRLSREWGLVTWDKPAAPCLSSRIAYGVPITPARLARVERAELALRRRFAAAGLVVRDLRVRDLGGPVRVEVDAEHVAAVAELAVGDLLAEAGFAEPGRVAVVPFRSGALNDGLPDAGRQPAGPATVTAAGGDAEATDSHDPVRLRLSDQHSKHLDDSKVRP